MNKKEIYKIKEKTKKNSKKNKKYGNKERKRKTYKIY
jgi:hypothetical protein